MCLIVIRIREVLGNFWFRTIERRLFYATSLSGYTYFLIAGGLNTSLHVCTKKK